MSRGGDEGVEVVAVVVCGGGRESWWSLWVSLAPSAEHLCYVITVLLYLLAYTMC